MYTTVSYDNLDTYLAGLAANTQDTPYEIEISPVTVAFLHGDTTAGTLQYVLHNNATKYVSLKFDVPAELTTASSMLAGCKTLISVDISGMTRVTDTYRMFMNCIYLASVILPNMASVTRAHSMFTHCLSLTSVDVSGMSRVTDTHGMFGNCNNLASVILPTMAGVTDASGMFAICDSLTTIDVSGMTSVTDASSMFQDCGHLTSVDVSGMTSVRNTRWMFSSCSSLENISLPTMTNVSQAGSMFKNCTRLTEIHGWSVPPTADMTDCFSGCTALEAIYVPEPSPSESSWRAWDIRKDTANSRSTVTVYKPDGTSNSVSVPSAGTYTMKVTDKVDELLFSPSEEIPAATIQKMLQTKAPITAKDALDPTKDNFALLAKDRSSARTNVTTDVIEAGNKLPPTSEAVRAAIGGAMPVGTVIYYYGLVAPSGWFICDGTDTTGTPDELSTHHPELYALLGNTNVLPDLRGEFLRGAGTNSHASQGNGGNVGYHQDATILYPQIEYAHDVGIKNQDSNIPGITQSCFEYRNSNTFTRAGWTFRPTNTSLNIIIKG